MVGERRCRWKGLRERNASGMHRPGKSNALFTSQVETRTGGQSTVKGSWLFVSPFQQPCRLKRRIPPGRIPSFDLPCPTMAAVSTTGMDSTRYNASKRPPKPRFDNVRDIYYVQPDATSTVYTPSVSRALSLYVRMCIRLSLLLSRLSPPVRTHRCVATEPTRSRGFVPLCLCVRIGPSTTTGDKRTRRDDD